MLLMCNKHGSVADINVIIIRPEYYCSIVCTKLFTGFFYCPGKNTFCHGKNPTLIRPRLCTNKYPVLAKNDILGLWLIACCKLSTTLARQI